MRARPSVILRDLGNERRSAEYVAPAALYARINAPVPPSNA